MFYNIIQVTRLRRQELLRAAEQYRLADIARAAHQPQRLSSMVSTFSVLNEMGHGLAALGLWKSESREQRKAYR